MRTAANRRMPKRPEIVAAAIRTIAANRRVTMMAVADSAGCGHVGFYKRMRGDMDWRLAELEGVAEYLGTTVADLLVDPLANAARTPNMQVSPYSKTPGQRAKKRDRRRPSTPSPRRVTWATGR